MKKLRPILLLLFVLFMNVKAIGQTLTYTFIDPCTKEVTYFHVPIQGGTVIFFLGQQRSFTAADVASGDFANWTNQVYADYRKVSPCGVQQGQVTQNQITSQIIGGTVQSVVGSIMSQAKSESATNTEGGSDAAGKNNKSDEKKLTKNNNGTNNSNGTSSGSSSNQNGGQSQDGSGTSGSSGEGTGTQGDGNTTSGGGSTGSGNSTQGGSSSSQPPVGGSAGGTGTTPTETKTETQGTEVVGSTTMTVDAKNDRGSESSSSGGGGKKSGNSNSRSNPLIISSDLTNAQNLNKTYTGIINIGTSRSSLTGSSSWGITSMIWFNLKQTAISGRYTKIHYSKDHKLKLIHNVNLTGVYSYGNYLGFVGYSAILNAGKWGITGTNVSGAITKTPDDNNLFISPSITAFYTKPFRVNKKIMMSPELYVISTPLIYSSVDKISVTDRTFSAFIGTGIDYQITKRFKVNMNYKANMSTNPSFPILSFFLIGSKINL